MVAAEIEDLKLEKDGAEYILCLNCELPKVEFCLDLDSFNAFITSSWKTHRCWEKHSGPTGWEDS